MAKRIFNLAFLACSSLFIAPAALSGESVIKFKSEAPAGTKLRIMSMPYNEATVTGADTGDFVGEYFVKEPGAEITLAGTVEQLEVYGCSLSELVIESAPDLMILKCNNNQLEALDVTNCDNLQILNCNDNKIATLDVASNSLLEQLNASSNVLTDVNLGVKENLELLYVSGNNLSSLDASGCQALKYFRADNNRITELDLSANAQLEDIRVYSNQLVGEEMDAFVDKLPQAVASPSLVWIVDTRDESEGNVCLRKNVAAAAAKAWASWDYKGGADDGAGAYYYGADYVPEITDNTITLTTSRNVGETITLDITASGNVSISGIVESSGFTGKNTFTLASQTVEVKGDISMFECPGNDVTSLTFDGDINLTYLDCKNNKIESLDLTDARLLTQLYASNNNLSRLNLAGCDALMRVDCYLNNLKGNAMTAMMQSLRTATDEPYLFVIDTKSPTSDRNIALKSDVAVATSKGWAVFDYVNGDRYGMGQRYEGSDPVEPTTPDEYFTITRESKDYMIINVEFADNSYSPTVEGATIAGWNDMSLTINMTDETVKVYGDAVMLNLLYTFINAVDVTNLPNLTNLYLGLDDVSTLDLGSNPKLQMLSCECNLLSELDLSVCKDLTYLNCYGNQIKGDDMTAMINSLPVRTAANHGTLIVYDSSYSSEGNICLESDVNAALRKYWAVYELVDNEPVLYRGYDYSGVEEVASDGAGLRYDAVSGIVYTSVPTDIEVYSVSGLLVAREFAADVDMNLFPSGVYLIRAAGKVLKIAK